MVDEIIIFFSVHSNFIKFSIAFRSNHQRCSIRKGVRNFTKFTVKHLCQSLFLNKVAGLRRATLLKKRLWHRCFPVNFVKFLITSFFIEQLWWLLLSILAPNFFTKQNTKLTRTDFCDLFVIAKKVFAILDKFVSVAASK